MEKFEEYRESDIHWLSEIPKSWKTKRLALNGEFYKGKGISKNQLSIEGEDVVLYGDIYTRYDLSTKKFERKAPLEVVDYSFELKYNDLLFTASGETKEDIGKALAFTGSETSYAGGDVIVYRQNKIDAKYLSYLFNSYKIREKKAKESKGEIVVHIYSSQLKDIKFPIPDGKTRKKILAYLDKKTAQIDRIITAKEKLIKLYEEEKTAIINKAVTQGIDDTGELVDSGIDWLGMIPAHWEVKPLKYVTSINDEKLSDKTKDLFQLLYVDIGSVSLENGIEEKTEYSFENAPSRARRKVKDGDILVSTVRTYLKAITPVIFPEENLIVSTGFAVIRPREITPDFLSAISVSNYFVDAIMSFSDGVSYPAINPSQIGSIFIAMPTADEQDEISAYVKEKKYTLNKKISKSQKLIDLLTEYRTTLINDVVTGKIKIT